MSATTAESRLPSAKKILIVDDHPILRRGLRALIESEPDLVVCGEASTSRDALELVARHLPDLIVVDLNLDRSDGLDLLKEVGARHPSVPAMVLSMHDETLYAERALRAGARGYVCKQQLEGTMLTAIRRVLAGEVYMSGSLASRLAAQYVTGGRPAAKSPLAALSDRELQVFRLIGLGRTTREIAEALGRSIKTIESHREHIKQKLHLTSGAALARRAAQSVESES